MTAEFLEGILATPLIGLLFIEAAIVLSLRTLVKNDSEGISPWFYALLGFLFARDVATAVLPTLPVAALSDALAPVFVLGATARSDKRRFAFSAAAASSAAIVLAAALVSGGIGLPAKLAALFCAAALSVLIFVLKETDGGITRMLSLPAKALAFAGLILPPLAALAFPDAAFLRGRVIVPLAYLAFIFVILDYARVLEDKLLYDRDYLSDTIDTLYNFVLNASENLRGGLNFDGLLEYVAATLREETNADGSLVLMIDDFEDLVTVRALDGTFPPLSVIPEELDREPAGIAAWLRELRIPLGEGLIGQTAQSGKPSLIPDAAADKRIIVEPAMPAGSVMAVPLLIADRVIGVGVVARNAGNQAFGDADFDRVSLLADFASLVINSAFSFMDTSERGEMDREAAIAANIQKALQPKRIPEIPTATFGAFSVPARGVSSDYYDIIHLRRDRVYLVMGDVAGKGVPASLIMVMIRAILHLLVGASKDTATILNWINRGITGKIELDHFATLQILVLDPTTGKCEFANAGHRPPVVWRKTSETLESIDMKSVPIGVEKAGEYVSTSITLADGDVLLLYTDGVVEALNSGGAQYGMKNLHEILRKHHKLSSKEIANRIHEDVRAFIGDVRQHDDQTLLAVKVNL